jgi:hypothetical protein
MQFIVRMFRWAGEVEAQGEKEDSWFLWRPAVLSLDPQFNPSVVW